ncbi:hypothetical protein [Lentilactobacillus kisonensis]|uniref:Uncharacterized protein n=2 Tax=Lentilactobacillus kisonensis TaxID=481722 RepID=H1LBR4_9LACO|nr:hypothetical protein [Lentilactobacillus kisonensis]EHO54630.1 hypothetical protein HMPREF9104_00024 [Lentilactobacillus kisonensis F0435]KRL21932.1 hypothetical protein FC98_GL000493 [Lentilactobacillus kisonensis DSM 19906 = JCM 15041]
MKRNNLIQAVIIVVIAAILVPFITNLVQQKPLLTNFPFGLLGILALAYVSSLIKAKQRYFYGSYFIIYLVALRLIGGYHNWTSWLFFILIAGLLSYVTDLLRRLAFSKAPYH